ncbi:MAG TPA: hypothetical protein VF550_02625 [Polyangia bacterium]
MLALFGAGCGGGHSSGNAYVTAQWSVADLGNPSKGLRCEDVGGGDVVVTMFNNAYSQDPNPSTATFPCASYAGSTYAVPRGTYTIVVSFYGDVKDYGKNPPLLDELSVTQTLVNGPNPLGATDFLVNSFVLGWSVTSGGFSSSCTAVGGSYVELDVTFPSQSQPSAYYLDCLGYNPAATLSIPVAANYGLTSGYYDVSLNAYLVDANYTRLATGALLASYRVTDGVQADLGTAYFTY